MWDLWTNFRWFGTSDVLAVLANHARQRVRPSGLIQYQGNAYRVDRASYDIKKLLKN